MALLSILSSDILPIFAIAMIGYLLERRLSGSAKVLSAVAFNALSPCLVFTQLVTTRMSTRDMGRMALFSVLLIGVMGGAGWLASRALQLNRRTSSSFLLVVMFSNSGNYALPVILFAFGNEALAFASVLFVTTGIAVYTLGVLIAASGSRSLWPAVAGIARVPAVYALAAAGAMRILQVEPPMVVMRPAGLLSDAAIPVMLLVLGMQLKRAGRPERPLAVTVAVVLSLVLSPIAGMVLAMLLGLTGPAREAAIVLSAMPAAVITTVIALEYDLDSNFITSVVFASTLLSPLSLVLLIAYLQQL